METAIPKVDVVLYRLDGEGRWFAGGGRVTHKGILKLLNTSVRQNSEGRYVVSDGVRFAYVDVEDTPVFVTRVDARHGGSSEFESLELTYSNGGREPADPARFSLEGEALYTITSAGERAKFLRGPYHELLALACEGDDGVVGLRVAGRFHPLVARSDTGD